MKHNDKSASIFEFACPHLRDHRTQKAKRKSTRFCPDPNHPSRNGYICRTVLLHLFLIVRLAKGFVNKFALLLLLNTDTLLCVCRHKKDTIKIAKKHTQRAGTQSHDLDTGDALSILPGDEPLTDHRVEIS